LQYNDWQHDPLALNDPANGISSRYDLRGDIDKPAFAFGGTCIGALQRNATQRNATQRNATQRNATQRNATQRNATQLLANP
jgi:hypothetical protein